MRHRGHSSGDCRQSRQRNVAFDTPHAQSAPAPSGTSAASISSWILGSRGRHSSKTFEMPFYTVNVSKGAVREQSTYLLSPSAYDPCRLLPQADCLWEVDSLVGRGLRLE